MPRAYPNSHLAHGVLVGYSLKKRANVPTYFVYFRGRDGRRLERDTNHTAQQRARDAAHAVIEAEYAPPGEAPAEKVTWDEARGRLAGRLAASGIRPATAKYYEKLIRSIRGMFAETDGPVDVSPGMAEAWRDAMMTQPGRGKKPRSAHTVASMVGGLAALWEHWFCGELKICSGNPWADVAAPKTDKLPVRVVSDDQYEHFVTWLGERFSGWPLPVLFFRVKEYTGCRLADVCALKSNQVRNGRVVFTADQTKGRKERQVPLPPDLADALEVVKGKTHLWESHPAGLKAALAKKGWPTHRLNPVFDPNRLYQWVATLFADYNAAFPDRPRITSHMFRKRAFTRAYQAGVPLDDAAVALGCNVDTIKGHYLGVTEQEITDAVFAKLYPAQQTAQQSGKPGGG